MREVFVVNGFPGCGKTTFGQMVGAELAKRDINFIHASSIDPIKHLLQPRVGWDSTMVIPNLWDEIERRKRICTSLDWDGKTKDVYWRGIMSQFKQQLLDMDPSLVHQYVINQVLSLAEPCVVFVDIREPENIDGFKSFCRKEHPGIPVKAIFIESDHSEAFDNSSDARVKEYSYDFIVDNRRSGGDTLEKLKTEVEKFCYILIS